MRDPLIGGRHEVSRDSRLLRLLRPKGTEAYLARRMEAQDLGSSSPAVAEERATGRLIRYIESCRGVCWL